jgi:hypothetical protein
MFENLSRIAALKIKIEEKPNIFANVPVDFCSTYPNIRDRTKKIWLVLSENPVCGSESVNLDS